MTQGRDLSPHGEPNPPALPWVIMALVSLVVGIVAGYGAVFFRGMISVLHNLLFLGRFSFHYDANVHTPASPWGILVVLVPIVGAVGVVFLVQKFATEARGHGVPEVMDAIYFNGARIRPRVAVIKSLASALSIGSGGSVGREGPIVQIGAAFGSLTSRFVSMPVRQRAILVAAGAGGGIGATFNTPIGGIVFAAELMMPVINPTSLLYVATSSLTATYIGRQYFGFLPSFNVPSLALAEGPGVGAEALPWFVVLGLVIGGAAWVLTRGIYWFEDRFNAMPGNNYTRHMAGMFLVGALFVGFMSFSHSWFGQPGHYYVQGVGYATIMDILEGRQTAVAFLLVLAAAKVLATCLTLGSGASGGVFSPSLFVGATLGGALGSLLQHLIPGFHVSPAQFAYAGMAAMIGGTTGAAVTGTIMVFEMTRDYAGILPVILTVVLATAVRSRLERGTIYTLKLIRRGHVVPQGLQAWTGELRSRDVMTPDFVVLPAEGGIDESVVDDALRQGRVVVLLGKEGTIQGIVDQKSRFESGAASSPHVVVAPDVRMEELLRTMRRSGAHVAVVARFPDRNGEGDVLGVITERSITRLAHSRAELSD